MFQFWHHHGMLGINARNLLYIKPLNQKAQIRFADDKIRTKQFLSVRGVKTARLLGKITSEAELLKFPWDSLPGDFVLKPNSGYGGEGIWIIKDRENNGWLNSKGEYIPHSKMLEHVTDILEGRYSITGGRDSVFFEQRLVCHPDMSVLGKFGLPDIRVIVYNLVPVMAMIRVPTEESRGKANLHMGGLGLGVDLSKGEITHMSHYNRIIKHHPDFGDLKGVKIPFWNEVLLQATQIQQLITLGYLAVDIVIDADMGPTLLEINARAGLGVQIANLAPLRDRLDRVSGVKVQTPEKGVRLAQDLFGNKMERRIQALSGKKVIGMEEETVLNLKHGTKTVLARMNPMMNKNYIDTALFKKIDDQPDLEKLTLGYTLQGERGKNVFHPLNMADRPHKVIFGRKVLSNFFLDVSRTPEVKKIPSDLEKPPSNSVPAVDDQVWHTIDNQLAEIDRALGIVAQIRPINLSLEKEKFFSTPDYEPQFVYKAPPENLDVLRSRLEALKIDTRFPLGRLFEEKRKELIMKAALMAVIGDDQYFPQRAEELMMPPESVRMAAEKALKTLKPAKKTKPGVISSTEAAQQFQNILDQRELSHWKVALKEGIVSRCVVGKNNRLLIKSEEMFSERDIKKLIAHEIETHVYCTENGKLQPYQIFRRGTAHYLKTQEGLAVYHQNQIIRDGATNAILGFNAVMWGRNSGFREVYQRLLKYLSPEESWKMTVKVKRGLSDTGRPGAFMKNALYFWGYLEVHEYLEKGGKFEDLFLGKFSLSQLDLIRQIKGIKSPRYVPERNS
jgi:alpha-L-glutamate ligase-like protein